MVCVYAKADYLSLYNLDMSLTHEKDILWPSFSSLMIGTRALWERTNGG